MERQPYSDIQLRTCVRRLQEVLYEAEVPESIQRHIIGLMVRDEAEMAAARAWQRVADRAEALGVHIQQRF